MRRVVLDTNVLVSFLTDRNADQQTQAAALLEAAAKGEVELILHQMVISEMVYVLGNLYRVETVELARTVNDLLSSAGIKPVNDVVWARVLELWPRHMRDLADAVLATVAIQEGYNAIATFDQRFVRQLHRAGIPTPAVDSCWR